MDYTSQNSELLQAALQVAEQGHRVFPLAPLTKKPFFKDWPWQEAATEQLKYVEQWWKAYPNCNVGMVAGELLIVDIDRKQDKPDGWVELGNLIDDNTVWSETPNDGFHFWYNSPGVKLRQAPGVDIQTGNKYIVLPPSYYQAEKPGEKSGPYEWGNPFGEFAILDTPPGIIQRLQEIEQQFTQSDMPLIPENLPEMPWDRLEDKHREFLYSGIQSSFNSRSEMVHSLVTRLYRLSYYPEQVLGMLWNCDQVYDVATDHRRGDPAGALEWLWLSCDKKQDSRVKTPAEAHEKQQSAFERIREKATQVRSEDLPGIREVFHEAAVDKLSDAEIETLIGIFAIATGDGAHTKATLRAEYKTVRKQVRSSQLSVNGVEPQFDQNGALKPITENLDLVLRHEGVAVRYDTMRHREDILIPGASFHRDEARNNALTYIADLFLKHGGANERRVQSQIKLLASQNLYHPFMTQLAGKQWDGAGRVQAVTDTLQVRPEHQQIRDTLVRRWLISVVATVYGTRGRPTRGVLVLQGPQYCGKTTWFKKIAMPDTHKAEVILKAADKDDQLDAFRYLTVELAELGGTKSVSELNTLKALISRTQDNIRRSYAREHSELERTTVFCGSVNENEFLTDATGNTRWWTVPCVDIGKAGLDRLDQLMAGIGQEQFWLEVYNAYAAKEPWHLTQEEGDMLEAVNEDHRSTSYTEDRLREIFDWDGPHDIHMKGEEIREKVFGNRALSPQEQKEFKQELRRRTGQTRGKATTRTLDGVRDKGKFYLMPRVLERGQNVGVFTRQG